jgi:hypothetical protein
MKKAILLAAVVLGLMVVGTPRSEACHTHGYVRASTLNDLFSGLPGGANSDVSFSAGGLSGNQLGNVNLDTMNWGGSQYGDGSGGDGHSYSWKVTDGKNIHFGATLSVGGDVNAELEGIIGDVELALDAQYDKDYAD